uniref:Uncharacterized protein n=1 Tax=Lepeophtheirus salmonis TaxID=72036 RepID=A0A0K2UFN0_LEPSM
MVDILGEYTVEYLQYIRIGSV